MINRTVLITGSIGLWAFDVAEIMQKHSCKVTLAAVKDPGYKKDNSIHFDLINEDMQTLPSVYQSGGFDTVIYVFSCESESGSYPYNQRALYGRRIDELRQHLMMFEVHTGIRNLYLVTDKRVFGEDDLTDEFAEPDPESDAGSYIRLAEEIFMESGRQIKGRNWTVVRTSHVFSKKYLKEFVASFTKKDDLSQKRITLFGFENDSCRFIAAEDIGEFFSLAVQTDLSGYVHIEGAEEVSYKYFSELIKNFGIETSIVNAAGRKKNMPQLEGKKAFTELGWIPKIRLSDVLNEADGSLEAPEKKKKLSLDDIRKKLGKMIPLIETAAGAILLNLLLAGSSGNTLLEAVDYRLFYCVIIGSAHGISWGWIAGVIACLSYSSVQLKTGDIWDILMNMDNWIPYVIYMTAGGITGYLKTSSDNRIRELEKTVLVRENELKYIKELHQQTCELRDNLQEQVINSRDSYGKIYGMVSELDSLYPDEILLRSVQVYEDILDNHSIVIYQRTANQRYIRKLVESKEAGNVPNSVNLDNYPLLQPYLEDGRLFTNKEFIEGYPAYCITIKMTELQNIMFVILRAKPEQYTKYYQNLIRIVAQLTRMSLSKAIVFLNAQDRYVDGTILLKQNEFIQAWKIRRQIKLENAGEYAVLKFSNALPDDVLSERLVGTIRTIDVAGKMNDGNRFAILLQANDSNVQTIISRMENNGIAATVSSDSEIALYAG